MARAMTTAEMLSTIREVCEIDVGDYSDTTLLNFLAEGLTMVVSAASWPWTTGNLEQWPTTTTQAVPAAIPIEFHQAIVWWAISKVFLALDSPTTAASWETNTANVLEGLKRSFRPKSPYAVGNLDGTYRLYNSLTH